MAQLVPSFSPHNEYKFPTETFDLSVLTDYEVPSPSLAFSSSWAESQSPYMYHPTSSPRHSAASSPSHCAPCSPGGHTTAKSYLPLTIKQEVPSYSDLVQDFNCSAQTAEDNYFSRPNATPYSRPKVAAVHSNEDHALLRQYLRDTSFQQKVNFQPLLHDFDSAALNNTATSSVTANTPTIKVEPGLRPPTASGPAPAASGHVIRDKLASVMSLVMEQVCEEVRVTCDTLGISPDPCQWSPDDVNAWLLWTSKQCGLPGVPFDLFYMDGTALAAITEEQFRQRASHGGEMLYAKLDIWKSAWQHRMATAAASPNLANQNSTTIQQPQQNLPTFQIEESCPDMSDILSVWFVDNGAENSNDNKQNVPAQNANHLMIPTSVGSDPLSPFTDTSSATEDFASDDEDEGETENGARTSTAGSSSSHIHLWQFLKELLSQPTIHGTAIRWVDRSKGVFKIEDSVRVARLWGRRKNRPAMNYDKLSRSIRQYYRKGIMKKTERSQRLVYQFCHPYCL